MKEKAIIYPFDIYSAPIVRHKQSLTNYEIVGVVSPNGWGITGKDAGIVDGGTFMGISVCSNFEDMLDNCDTVIFTESANWIDFDKNLYPKIVSTIKAKKNIVLSFKLNADIREELIRECEKSEVCFKCINEGSNIFVQSLETDALCEINTPVIFILGTTDRTHKFEIQLSLREHLLKMGYRVGQIGSRNGCELFGVHSFPEFMYDHAISGSNKIIMFNRYIKKIEEEEEPDVLVIGIPGGIMPLNKKHTNNFGLMAFKVANAISPDAVVFSSTYEEYTPDYFEKIATSIKYKLGFEVDAYVLSNIKIDWESSNESQLHYLKIDSGFVNEKVCFHRKERVPVYNILNQTDSTKLVNLIVDKLTKYGDVQSM